MIEKFGYEYLLICDECGEEFEESFERFIDAVAYKQDKHHGWRSFKNADGEWNDICPDCMKQRMQGVGIAKGRGDLLDE